MARRPARVSRWFRWRVVSPSRAGSEIATTMCPRPSDEVTTMSKMRTTWLIPGFVALAAASCTFDRLPPIGGDDDGPMSLELLAGDIGGAGNVDGTGPAARFR